jgi:lipopolysaccharide transport system permease protein
MKLRYKRSVLGFVWSLINPLAQLLVLNFVFSHVLPLDIPHYTVFLFTGLLVWTWFQSSLLMATGSIVDNRDLVRKPGFPAAILPVVSITTNFIHFLLAFPMLVFFLLASSIPLTAVIFTLPILFALQFLLTLSLAFMISAFHVVFRDTQYLLGIALLLGFYLSPVFYDASIIPENYQFLYQLNPLVLLIGSYRKVLLEGEIPPATPLLALGIAAAALLLIGYDVFRRSSHSFIEEL